MDVLLWADVFYIKKRLKWLIPSKDDFNYLKPWFHLNCLIISHFTAFKVMLNFGKSGGFACLITLLPFSQGQLSLSVKRGLLVPTIAILSIL